MPFLVISEILGLFVNILAADQKHSLCNWEHLRQLIEMQLSKKKTSCWIFCFISEFTSNFEHFQKNDDPQSLCISEIMDSKRRVYINI